MRLTFHHIAAYCLLVLLPLQALASVAAVAVSTCNPAMASCPTVMHENANCCEHSTSTAMQHKHNAGSHCQSSSCTVSCMATGLISIPSDAIHAYPLVAVSKLAAFLTPHYQSFIPEGLQRPPSILA